MTHWSPDDPTCHMKTTGLSVFLPSQLENNRNGIMGIFLLGPISTLTALSITHIAEVKTKTKL